jgi:hypothetical protein
MVKMVPPAEAANQVPVETARIWAEGTAVLR